MHGHQKEPPGNQWKKLYREIYIEIPREIPEQIVLVISGEISEGVIDISRNSFPPDKSLDESLVELLEKS